MIKKSMRWLGYGLFMLVTALGVVYLLTYQPAEEDASISAVTPETQVTVPEPVPEPVPVSEPETAPIFDATSLQAAVDLWVNGLSGTASVVITDVDGRVTAEHKGAEHYFGASIYKLYTAYFGYQQIDSGAVMAEEIYLGQSSRAECLDAMIRSSDSPCAEQLRAEIGSVQLNTSLAQIGINDSDMAILNTTASDAAAMMARIARGEGLSEVSQAAFLISAKDQIYRDALNAGFSSDLTVYNKIGFRDFDEYHDVALVELSDGRQFVLAVLTDGVGTRAIAELAVQVEALILQ